MIAFIGKLLRFLRRLFLFVLIILRIVEKCKSPRTAPSHRPVMTLVSRGQTTRIT